MKNNTFDVVDFGACGDGKTLNTEAIQAAVDACAAVGGGRVVVPAGTFLSGAIHLRSHVNFHLGSGATLLGSRNLADYPPLVFDTHGYHIDHWYSSLLTGVGLENVSITGNGTLNGQGEVWWKARDEGRLTGERPVLISLNDCERVLIRDIMVMNSPSWTLRLMLCRNLTVDNVTVKNPWGHYHNNDGINLVSCRDAQIVNCHVDTGDDGITLKSIPDHHMVCHGRPDPTKPHIPCENIIVSNCVVRHAHGGVVIGSETVGGVNNIAVSNCIFEGTRAGVKIKGSPFGGAVENVRVSNLIMKRVEYAIDLQVLQPEQQKPSEGLRIASIRGIHFQGITAEKSCIAIAVAGQPESPIHDISFSHMQLEADAGIDIRHACNVRFDDITLETRSAPMLAQDVTGLVLRQFSARAVVTDLPVLQFERVRDAWIHGCKATDDASVFLGLVGSENEVTMDGNRLSPAITAERSVEPVNSWNICSHAFSGSRWIRDTGERNPWLPLPAAVNAFVRSRWTAEQVDRIYSISRVEANSRPGAEGEGRGKGTEGKRRVRGTSAGDESGEHRRIYMIEARDVLERLVVFEDGKLLRVVEDLDFHAHTFK